MIFLSLEKGLSRLLLPKVIWLGYSEPPSRFQFHIGESSKNNGCIETFCYFQFPLKRGFKVSDMTQWLCCLYRILIFSTSIFVLDPPSENPSISSSSQSFVYTSGDIMNLTCIVRGGNPLANLSWNCISNDWEVERHSNYTQTALILKVDKRFNNKNCTCIATHPLKTKFKSEKLTVYCKYRNDIIN